MEFNLTGEKSSKYLLAFGILLLFCSVIISDLGLDSHVLMAVEDGALPWGHTRNIDPLASDQSYAPQYYDRADVIYGMLDSEIKLKSFVFLSSLILIFVVGYYGIRKQDNDMGNEFDYFSASIIALYPAFIFATGRGYLEVPLALIFLLSHLNFLKNSRHGISSSYHIFILGGLGVAAIAWIKGITVLIGIAWLILLICIEYVSKKLDVNKKIQSMVILNVASIIAIVALLTLDHNSIGNSLLFSFAAIIDIFIFLAVGLCLIAIFTSKQNFKDCITENYSAMIIVNVVVLGCIYWIADLWLTEAKIWDTPGIKIFFILGNNGRYVTLIAPFLIILTSNFAKLKHLEMNSKIMTVNLCLILILSSLAGFHGQKMWTDEAADSIAESLVDGQDFLLIHEPDLAMHWLYTMHSELSDSHPNSVGHWRAPSSGFEAELNGQEIENRGNLSEVSFLVIQPGLDIEINDDWQLADSGKSPLIMGADEWLIYEKSL